MSSFESKFKQQFKIIGYLGKGTYGIAFAVEAANNKRKYAIKRIDLQKTGGSVEHEVVGTPRYMAPEQKGNRYDFKVDIYSLGLIYFEMLVRFDTDMERSEKIKLLQSCLLPDNIPPHLRREYNLLMSMLSVNPNERPTILAIKEHLGYWRRSDLIDIIFSGLITVLESLLSSMFTSTHVQLSKVEAQKKKLPEHFGLKINPPDATTGVNINIFCPVSINVSCTSR